MTTKPFFRIPDWTKRMAEQSHKTVCTWFLFIVLETRGDDEKQVEMMIKHVEHYVQYWDSKERKEEKQTKIVLETEALRSNLLCRVSRNI